MRKHFAWHFYQPMEQLSRKNCDHQARDKCHDGGASECDAVVAVEGCEDADPEGVDED